jgi:alkylation response protein AidB-like acyl-CoA dehydrogenase
MRAIDEITRPLEYLSPMDRHLGEIIRSWADNDVIPNRRQYDEDWKDHHLIEPAFKSLMVDLGLQRFLFPEDLGGMGFGHSSYLGTGGFRIFEEVARADSAIAVAAGVVFWPLIMICNEPHVNRRLCQELAPRFCDTDKPVFAANAMTEPQGGADIENLDLLGGSTIRTSATLDGDEWVINGHKLWPTNSGGVADLFGVVCSTRPGSRDPNDFAFIFVPADAEGVTQGGPYQKAGMAADKNSDIWFENVRVPSWYRAHGPGDDYKYFKEVVSFGLMGSLAFTSGVLLNTYEILQEATARLRFRGRPLKENDDIAGQLSEFAATVETVRILGYQFARMIDRRDLYGMPWSDDVVARGRAYKLLTCDMAVKSLRQAMDLLGAHGSDRAGDVEKHWRDFKIVQLWMGGKQLCQMEVARHFFECETL